MTSADDEGADGGETPDAPQDGAADAPAPETPAAAGAVTDADIVQGYRFFLGRDPESAQAMDDRRGAPPLGLVAEMMGSGEYAARIIEAALADRAPSGDLFSDTPPADALAWAAAFLPLTDPNRRRVARARNWCEAHGAVVGDPALREALPDLAARLPLDAGAARLDALGEAVGSRRFAGELEEATARVARGWLIDRAAPEETLGVELWLDGRLAAVATAAAYSPEAHGRFGGSGRHGFLFERFMAAGGDEAADSSRPLRIEIRPGGSRLVLASAEAARPPRGQDAQLAGLREDVRQARRTLEGVERALAELSAALGFAPDTWDAYVRAYDVRTPRQALEEAQADAALAWRPRVQALVAGGPYDPAGEDQTRASLAAQSYPPHAVALVRPGDASPALDSDYAVIVDAGDRLAPDALHRIASAVQGPNPPALVTMDSDTLEPDGTRRDPVLRPGFDPDLLLQQASLGATAAVRSDVLRAVLAAGGSLAPDDRHDLWLRVWETAGDAGVRHIPRVLHHAKAGGPPADPARLLRDAQAHLARTGSRATAEPDGEGRAQVRIAWPLPEGVRAAVVIPTRDRLDLLEPCLAGLEGARAANRTAMQLVVVDNDSADPSTDEALRSLQQAGRIHVLPYPGAFNWSAINNAAARAVEADVLVFLNNDTAVLAPDWLDALCAQAMRPEVGAVGARLLYADGTIQHAGVILGAGGALAAHEGAGAPLADDGYLGRRGVAHRSAAVTGACLATRRSLFLELGGFDAETLPVEASDIDYGLRVRHAGLAVIYEPRATLFHYESRSRGHTGLDLERRQAADRQLAALERRWGAAARRDPFYNPHFDRADRPFARLGPPPEG